MAVPSPLVAVPHLFAMSSRRAQQALSALVPPNEVPVGAELRAGGVLVSSLVSWAGANHGWTLDRLVCNIIDSQLFELFSDPEDGELLMATVSVPSPGPVAVIECDCDWVAESAGPAPAVPGAMMPVGRAAAVAVPRVAQEVESEDEDHWDEESEEEDSEWDKDDWDDESEEVPGECLCGARLEPSWTCNCPDRQQP